LACFSWISIGAHVELQDVGSGASERSRYDEAAAQLGALRSEIASTVETLKAAQKWSPFDRDNHDAHFAAVRALNRASIDPRSARVRRPDND